MLQLPPDPYKILGIAADATLADIRAAHRKLVKQCHPDKVSAEASDDEKRAKEDEFKRVQKAYELLIDDNARANYDEKVKMHKKFMSAKVMASAANTFASPPRRSDTWSGPSGPGGPGGPGVHPHVRTAEPRPDTFSSRSPPKDVPRQYHRSSREFDEPPRANVKVERDAPPKVRRGASYETHRSPTEEVRGREEELQRKLDEVKRELEREKEKASRQPPASDREKEKKPSKTEKSRSEKSRKEEKSSRSSKKDKDVYVEDPDEPYKSSKSKSSSKSTHKSSHRSSKHRDRSSSRSLSRSRHPTKKSSREKAPLQPEVEEPDDTDSDTPHGGEFQDKYEAALAYQRQAGSRRSKESPDLRRAYTEGNLPPQVPSAPTPPPMANPAGPKPIIIDAKPSSRPSGQAGSPPGGFQSPPRVGIPRAHTMPHQGAYTSRVSIGPDADTYFNSPGGRGRSRSRLNQGYYPEDDEPEISGGQRPRRGSSNAYHTGGYTAESGGSSRMYTVRENPAAYYGDSGTGYYPSGHSPKGYSLPIHGGPPSGARVVPFGKMSTAKSYTYDDVTYSSVPHATHAQEEYHGFGAAA